MHFLKCVTLVMHMDDKPHEKKKAAVNFEHTGLKQTKKIKEEERIQACYQLYRLKTVHVLE